MSDNNISDKSSHSRKSSYSSHHHGHSSHSKKVIQVAHTKIVPEKDHHLIHVNLVPEVEIILILQKEGIPPAKIRAFLKFL